MKTILKATILSTLLVLTSCAHHKGCMDSNGQCTMKKDCKGDCKDSKGEQCQMKKDEAKTETPAKK